MRQVAPELVAELGEPYAQLWQLLQETYGPLDGARVLARVLGAVNQHGADLVGRVLEQAIESGRLIPSSARETPSRVEVPPPLLEYRVEMARAADYDALLVGGRRE